ncbi:hypothetical protein [Desulfobacca acetoxidans]|uniref:Aspartyl-tRNA synthetase n=1 Tax=Desulfobacca acetoxidans (strain ATCC 700848 / DSM 11109 / ASRB2) TaxID=880072 RepID=F2NIW0_DESAR|nr:hypothetical protein [Desulfobacca acetoxidans]AEB10654.1 aspartyl-tRNA synthetase [Desulfobacca acetoxidans DSM 11109]
MQIILNQTERDILFRQDPTTRHDGGYQSFLIHLQKNTNRATGDLTLTMQDLEKIPRYAFDYGNGGWEGRLKNIFQRHLGLRLGRE